MKKNRIPINAFVPEIWLNMLNLLIPNHPDSGYRTVPQMFIRLSYRPSLVSSILSSFSVLVFMQHQFFTYVYLSFNQSIKIFCTGLVFGSIISERIRIRTGRIRQIVTSLSQFASLFITKPTLPAAHTVPTL